MALIDDINNLPTSVYENTTDHLNHHKTIHAALKDHAPRLHDTEQTASRAEAQAESTDTKLDSHVARMNITEQAALRAESRATSAENKVDVYTPRVTALEAMNGVTPESPVDGQTANLIEQDDTLTRAALASNFAQVGADGKLVGGVIPTLSLAASPAVGASITPRGDGRRIVAYIYGQFIAAYGNHRLNVSTDAMSWTDVGPAPGSYGQAVTKILPTSDGEVMVATTVSLYRSSGWGTGTVSWSKKVDANSTANILPFSFNGRAGKFIVTEYHGSADRSPSRYAYISTDDGNTFTQVWDSNEIHGPVDGPLTHIHGVEYDHYADRFYLSEGHNQASAGLWVSVDDGATWMRPPGLFMDPSPTTVDVTPDGLVCGSDSGTTGLLGVVRQDNPMDERFIQTWRWETGHDGVVGFGISSYMDEDTGIVYVGFRSGKPGVAPMIAGGTPTAGGLVWEWDGEPALIADDVTNPVVVDGKLYASANIRGERYNIQGHVAAPGIPSSNDSFRVIGTKVEAGHGASVKGIRGTAVGVRAEATGVQDSTAIGYESFASVDAVALGSSAVAQVGTVVVGRGASSVAGNDQVVIGKNASTSGSASTAVGSLATAGTTGTSVGAFALAGTNSVSVGRSSKTTHNSVALGDRADATGANDTVVIGTASKVTAAAGTSVGSGSTAGYTSVSVGAWSKSSGSGVSIGSYSAAEGSDNLVAIGRGAKATVTGSVALGGNTTTEVPHMVAIASRGIHIKEMSHTPGTPDEGAVLYLREVQGVLSLCVKIAGSTDVHVIAPAPPTPA